MTLQLKSARLEPLVANRMTPFNTIEVSRRAWLITAAGAVLLTGLLFLPYWLGYLSAPSGRFYTGLLVNVEDANYITIIQRGSEGAWTHSLRFTSETDTPAFLYVFYLAWGHLARLIGLDATTMWHVARGVMTLVTFLIAYGFIAHFVAERSWRLVACSFAIFGAGFDWFAFPWEVLEATSATPVDLKMADAHLFSAALTFPHYLASISLLMILFWCVTRLYIEHLSRTKYAGLLVLAMLANVSIVLVYPFFVLLSSGVLFLYLVCLMVRARKFSLREGIAFGILCLSVLPLLLYYAIALTGSESLRVWAAQSQTLSPNPLHYFFAFALYLILALWDGWRVGLGPEAQKNRRLLLWVWVGVVVLLIYAPLGAQRRFLQGVQMPLAILAALGLFEVVLPRVRQARWFQALANHPGYSVEGLQRLLIVVLLLVASVSSVYQWLSAVALTTIVQPYPLFRPRGQVQAMDWLRTHAPSDAVVLGSYLTGSYLPLRSGTRTYIGHVYETIHFQAKQQQVDQFFAAETNDTKRIEFLRANHIAYLFYGRTEREAGGFNPSRAAYLKPTFQNEQATIYQVVLP
ncbi:MAG TPA: hypothetical protein VFD70_04875 [Anaerolineae bacterium]|nr:hypothetical protein [Anaerolineae bacterium]